MAFVDSLVSNGTARTIWCSSLDRSLNAPYILGLRSCLAPLALGITVILKGSEASPGVCWEIASILHEAGLPKSCLNIIIHRPHDAATFISAIIASSFIRKVTFTESANTGAVIASQAARLLKPSLVELGGKALTIGCDDADLEQVALGCALEAFLHNDQIYMLTERIKVHAAVTEKFKAALKSTLDQIFGCPGGLVLMNETPVLKNRQLLQDAVSKGAQVIYGHRKHRADIKTATWPVVVDNVKKEMNIYHPESLGLTVSLFVVNSDDQAIKLANDTDYGFAAAVFTEDLRQGLRIAKGVHTGAVHINSMSVHDESALPHGGHKKSGYGRFNSAEGLAEWIRTKTITWRD